MARRREFSPAATSQSEVVSGKTLVSLAYASRSSASSAGAFHDTGGPHRLT
jgi:hypothetical protein